MKNKTQDLGQNIVSSCFSLKSVELFLNFFRDFVEFLSSIHQSITRKFWMNQGRIYINFEFTSFLQKHKVKNFFYSILNFFLLNPNSRKYLRWSVWNHLKINFVLFLVEFLLKSPHDRFGFWHIRSLRAKIYSDTNFIVNEGASCFFSGNIRDNIFDWRDFFRIIQKKGHV